MLGMLRDNFVSGFSCVLQGTAEIGFAGVEDIKIYDLISEPRKADSGLLIYFRKFRSEVVAGPQGERLETMFRRITPND